MAFGNNKKKDILNDIDEITVWLDKRSREIEQGKTIPNIVGMPVMARVICGGEKEVNRLSSHDKDLYAKLLKDDKSTALTLVPVALGAATSGISISAVASGVGTVSAIAGLSSAGLGTAAFSVSAVSGMGLAGATVMIPALWPVGIGMFAISAGTFFVKSKKNKEKAEKAEKLQKVFERCQHDAKVCYARREENRNRIKEILSEKLKASVDFLSASSKKIAISIDDALNVDQNLRIMQYQEIVLKQYESQNEIRKMFSELMDAYNMLVAENARLEQQIAAYEANMKICGCAYNYL